MTSLLTREKLPRREGYLRQLVRMRQHLSRCHTLRMCSRSWLLLSSCNPTVETWQALDVYEYLSGDRGGLYQPAQA